MEGLVEGWEGCGDERVEGLVEEIFERLRGE